MGVTETTMRSVALPVAVLTFLRASLRKEAGPLGATHALHDAGFAAGELLHRRFEERVGTEASELDEGRFWAEASAFFQEEGWGGFTHERLHPALGILRAPEWAESNGEGTESQPGCAFSAGMLAYLLGQVAGGPVAVLEVFCRSRGDDHCGFLFGSEAAVHEVYGLLLDGDTLEHVLAHL